MDRDRERWQACSLRIGLSKLVVRIVGRFRHTCGLPRHLDLLATTLSDISPAFATPLCLRLACEEEAEG